MHLHSSQHFEHKCWVYWEKDFYFLSLNENYCHHATNYLLSNLNSWLQRKNSCTCKPLSIVNTCVEFTEKKIFIFCLWIRIGNVWYLSFFMSKSTSLHKMIGWPRWSYYSCKQMIVSSNLVRNLLLFLYKQLLSANISLIALKNLSIH